MAFDQKRPPNPKFNSPKGVFSFPKLGTPDTKFKAEGSYSVKLVLSAKDTAALVAKLQPLHDAAVAAGQEAFDKLPVATRKKLGKLGIDDFFTPVYDDQEQETGEGTFTFAMNATWVYKSGPKTGQTGTQRPDVFDSKGTKMDGNKVWSGSKGIVAFEVAPYWIPGTGKCGISRKLKAVQVIDLVTGGSRGAEGYGFTEQDGYSDEGNALPQEDISGAGDDEALEADDSTAF